jgi:hypothetical protein
MTSDNKKILSFCSDGYAIEVGTGTTGTAVTYDIPFDAAPTVMVTMTATGSGDDEYLQTNNTNNHTVTATTAKAYAYLAFGERKKKPGR